VKDDQLIIVDGMVPSEKLYILALIHGLGWEWVHPKDANDVQISEKRFVDFFIVFAGKLWYGSCREYDTVYKDLERVTISDLEVSYKKRLESGEVSKELKCFVDDLISKSGHLGGL